MPSVDTATRAQALALKVVGFPPDQIRAMTGIAPRTVNDILDRAIQRGFDPANPTIKDIHVEDAPRSGRPRKQEAYKDQVLQKIRADRYGREKTCASIAAELGTISPMTVWRILRKAGLKKTKPTRKPGLTKEMRAERLAWCLAHKDWTLEDWKKIIWSDETSVVLNHRRGGYKIWRTSGERFLKSCIRERWKGYSEFMFWGCFSYDQRGPCHIWKKETAKDRKTSEEVIKQLNEELEPALRQTWELETGMRRMGLRNAPGKKPEWKFTAKTGKLSRGKNGGIDWYRYQKEILLPKLLLFAKTLGPDALVQEDRAPAYAYHAQVFIYSKEAVERMVWVPNSPDLNMIEPAWPYLKRITTKKGAPKSRVEVERVWEKSWGELPQEKI